MSATFPENPSIDQLKKQAKELLRAFTRRDPSVIDRFRRIRRYASLSEADLFESAIRLHDAQYAVALHYGYASWRQLSNHCAQIQKEKAMNESIAQEFDELKDLPDRAMQRLLREIDAPELAQALVGATEATRDRVFANMSKRAGKIIGDTVETLSDSGDGQIEAARAKIVSIYRKLVQNGHVSAIGSGKGAEADGAQRARPIAIIQEKGATGFSAEDLKTLFPEISTKARTFGLLSLEADVEAIDDHIIKKGLQLVVDGTDPSIVETILRTMLEKELQQIRTKYEAAIDAVLSVQSGDSPHMVKEKLEARLP